MPVLFVKVSEPNTAYRGASSPNVISSPYFEVPAFSDTFTKGAGAKVSRYKSAQ